MIKKITTPQGERWAIVFDEYISKDNLFEIHYSLLDLLASNSQSEHFAGSGNSYYTLLTFLNNHFRESFPLDVSMEKNLSPKRIKMRRRKRRN